MGTYKEIEGDLIALAKEDKFNIIAHGCNCFNTMGSGVAKTIRENFPEAYHTDLWTTKGDMRKLGNYNYALFTDYSYPYLIVINAYTQFNYGADKVNLDYEALTLCLRKINHEFPGKTIGLPKIGAGLAGGDWNRIKEIIQKELKDMDVTIVLYK